MNSPKCDRGKHEWCDGTWLHAMGEADCTCPCHNEDQETRN